MTENTKRYENKPSFPCSSSETNQKVRRCVFFHAYFPGVYSLQQSVDHVMLCYNLKYEIIKQTLIPDWIHFACQHQETPVFKIKQLLQ